MEGRTRERLRLAVIGGGKGSNIGETHRIAARLDDRFALVAGVFSSNATRSKEMAAVLDIADERAYASWEALLDAEASRADKVDVIAIMTPHDSHVAIATAALRRGFHVICDKPLALSVAEAKEIASLVEQTGLAFCVTYCYSGYPMVRQARDMIAEGKIGAVRQIHVQYVQGHFAGPDLPSDWRTDAGRSGESMILLDIGPHAFQLGAYVSGLAATKVFADVGSAVPGRRVDDYASVLLHYENGARGSMWVTNAAAGSEHGLMFRIHGDEGGLEWYQEEPNKLIHRQRDGFQQIITRRISDDVSSGAQRSTRVPLGHPEGYLEAFANLYTEFADRITATRENQKAPLAERLYPGVEDGVASVIFADAARRSAKAGVWQEM